MKDPLLPRINPLTFAEFGTTKIAAPTHLFSKGFAESVYNAIHDCSYGTPDNTPANATGTMLAFFPEICWWLRNQMETLKIATDTNVPAQPICDFLVQLNQYRENVRLEEKKINEFILRNSYLRLFCEKFEEQAKRVVDYVVAEFPNHKNQLYSGEPQTKTLAEKPNYPTQPDKKSFCDSALPTPSDNSFSRGLVLSIYRQFIEFSQQQDRRAIALFDETSAVAIKNAIESAKVDMAGYVNVMKTIYEQKNLAKNAKYHEFLDGIAKQIGEHVALNYPAVAHDVLQKFMKLENTRSLEHKAAMQYSDACLGWSALGLTTRPSLALLSLLVPAVAASPFLPTVIPLISIPLEVMYVMLDCISSRDKEECCQTPLARAVHNDRLFRIHYTHGQAVGEGNRPHVYAASSLPRHPGAPC